MRTIHIGISHDHDLVVTKLRDIKVISVSFGESTSKCIDHSLDLRIGKHLVNSCFLHIQDLTSDRQELPGNYGCGQSLQNLPRNLPLR